MISLFNKIAVQASMLNKTPLVVLIATASSKEEADKIAADLVGSKLVACCNLLPGITSHYYWQGKVCCDSEVMIVMKSREALIDRITQRVKELHSYTVPEVIAMPIVGGSQEYISWVLENTLPE
jgi:periplasmic divalent cation tolerance protein